MNILKSVWFISLLLIAILFLFIVYPGIELLSNIPIQFQWVLRIFVFVAFLSIVGFLLFEVKYLTGQIKTLHEGRSDDKSNTVRTDDSLKELGLISIVDPEKNYQEITRQILLLAKSSLVAQTVYIYLFDEGGNTYSLQDFQTSPGFELKPSVQPENSIFSNFNQSTKPQIFNFDNLKDVRIPYYANPARVRTAMLVPIHLKKGLYLGVLGMDSMDKEAWGEEDIELAKSFADMYSQTIWQIDVIDKQRTQLQFFGDLCRINNEISLGINMLDLYKKVGMIIRKFYNFDKMTLATINNEESRELKIEYIEGLEADYSIGNQISLDGSLFQKIIGKGQVVSISDYELAGVTFRFQPGDLLLLPFRSCLGIPLELGRKKFGGILLESFKVNNYLPEEVETLSFLGKYFSEIINRIQIHQSIKQLALIDGLTGISNHRAFLERLDIEVERCRRYKNSLTLLILDFDKFKRVNDNHGHLFGDFVLKKTATIIRGSVRIIDMVARYGGEEFAVILVNSDKRNCISTAERIRSNIQSFIFEKDGIKEKITVSIGMSEYPTDGVDSQTIISAADIAMYQSKRVGGNKVTMYKTN